MFKRLKTIASYSGLARWLRETAEEPVGFIARRPEIPSPYSSGPTHTVEAWAGKRVIWVETKHRRYEIFEVPPEVTIWPTVEAADLALFGPRVLEPEPAAEPEVAEEPQPLLPWSEAEIEALILAGGAA